MGERYPLGRKNADGESVEVCLAHVDRVLRRSIDRGIRRGDNIKFYVEKLRMVQLSEGSGDEEGRVCLGVKHIGWNSDLDSVFLHEKDVLLIKREGKKFVVSLMGREPQFSEAKGSWNKFTVRPLLGGEPLEITDLSYDEDEILGRVVQVEKLER